MPASPPPASPLRASRLLVAQGFAGFALAGALQSLYGPTVSVLARLHCILPSEAGAIVGAHAAGGFAALALNMARGGITARHGLMIVAAGAALLALSPGWPVPLLGAAMVGAGAALNSNVFNRRFLSELGASGPRMLGILNALFGLGAVLGPLAFVLAGGRIAPAYGTLAVAALVLSLAAHPAARAPDPVGSPPLARVLRRPGILVIGSLGIGLELSLAGLGPAALVEGGMAEARAALWASGFFAAFVTARLALWWIADRIAPLRLVAGAFVLAALACGGVIAGLGGPAYAVTGAAAGVIFPAYFVGASRRLGTGERVSALVIAAGYAGAALVPAILSLLLARIGVGQLFGVLAAYGAVAAGAALLVRRGDGGDGEPGGGQAPSG